MTLNSDTTPVAKGGIIVLYATGEGVTNPPSTDGSIVTSVSTTPNLNLSLKVGTKDASILYSGGAVGLVSGMIQINARLPADIPTGKTTPVVLTINGVDSPAGVTIGVK